MLTDGIESRMETLESDNMIHGYLDSTKTLFDKIRISLEIYIRLKYLRIKFPKPRRIY